jgi:putative ABC transport system permease protein
VQEASTGQIDPFVSFWIAEASLVDGHGQPGLAFPIGCNAVGADYLKVMNIPLRMGRTFTPAELSAKRHVAVIDERLASTHFRGRNPLGERLRMGETAADDYEIVGVAANTRTPGPNPKTDPMVYQAADELLSTKLLVRIAGPAEPVKAEIERAAASLDPNVGVRVKRIEDDVDEAVTGVKVGALFASALGTVALLLACAGIYALVSFAVTRRRREVGIRMALGAEPRTVMGLMVWQGLKPVLGGALTGIAVGAGAARLIRAMLYGVSSVDPLSFGTTAILLIGAATIAAWVPARSALRVDPSVTLRHE